MRKLKPLDDKSWDATTIDEKLETLRHEMQCHQRQGAATAKALDEMRDRIEEIKRRLEDLLLD
jgi:uncharacterized coiled-coil DUF342 family protein